MLARMWNASIRALAVSSVLVVAPLGSLFSLGCGASARDLAKLTELKAAIQEPVNSREEANEYSVLVEDAADSLRGLSRNEVAAKIGHGDECATHPRCQELGFNDDDWFYAVGQIGHGYGGPVPILIVGFDRESRAWRTWNLRTHE